MCSDVEMVWDKSWAVDIVYRCIPPSIGHTSRTSGTKQKLNVIVLRLFLNVCNTTSISMINNRDCRVSFSICFLLTWVQIGRPLNTCDITISGLGNNRVCGLFRYRVAWSMVHTSNWDWSHEHKRIKWWVLYPHSLIPGLIGWLSTTFVPAIWYPTPSVPTSSISGRTGCPDGSSVSPSECHSYK